MTTQLTQENLARYIPDLWQYGTRLCASEDTARALICDTLDTALQKQWKRPASLTVATWLNMLMYRVFLSDYGRYSLSRHESAAQNAANDVVMPSLWQNLDLNRMETVH